jgi:tetratricopeptide (TPR) repeat protein
MMMKDRIRQAILDAERTTNTDPAIALFRLRWAAEAIADSIGEANSLSRESLSQDEFIDFLLAKDALSESNASDLHRIRMLGNRAVHDMAATSLEANDALTRVKRLASALLPGSASPPLPKAEQTLKTKTALKERIAKMQVASTRSCSHHVRPSPLRWYEIIPLKGLSIITVFCLLGWYSLQYVYYVPTPVTSQTIATIPRPTPAQNAYEPEAPTAGNSAVRTPLATAERSQNSDNANTCIDNENENSSQSVADACRRLAIYSQAIRADPNDHSAYFSRGVAYANLRNYSLAIADYTKAISLRPDAASYVSRGNAYDEIGDHQRAFSDYRQAILADPNYDPAYLNRGITYYNLHNYEEAIANYTRAIRLRPSADALVRRGNAYDDNGDHGRALADYAQAILIDPNFDSAYLNRGITYENLHQYGAAIVDLTQAIRLRPNAHAFLNRGNAYASIGNHQAAQADWAQAVRLDGTLAGQVPNN